MPIQALSPDFLIAELQARGLFYLLGSYPALPKRQLKDHQLLAQLASQQDARLRSALIPLFLHQPHFANALSDALILLSGKHEKTLKIYYTAAFLLQEEYQDQLATLIPGWRPLPDYFSKELDVGEQGAINFRLRQLGTFHTQLTGLRANWVGTYRQAAAHLIRRLNSEARWAA